MNNILTLNSLYTKNIIKTEYKKDFRKVINRATIISIVITFLLIYTPCFINIAVYAANYPGQYGVTEETALGNNAAIPLFFVNGILDSVLKPTAEILTGQGDFGVIYDALIEIDLAAELASAQTVLKTIAGFWVLILATSHMIHDIGQGQNALDCIYKFFIEFSVTAMFIIQSGNIMDALTGLGQLIAAAFGSAAFNYQSSVSAEEIIKIVTGCDDLGGGSFWLVQTLMSFFLPWVMSVFAGIIAKFAAIQILLEIAIRKMFAPLAIADIYKEGLRSPGARYLKKYFACVLRLSVCLFICLMISTCVESMFTVTAASMDTSKKCMDHLFALLTVEISGALLLFKAGEFANDAVGV